MGERHKCCFMNSLTSISCLLIALISVRNLKRYSHMVTLIFDQYICHIF
jgi:hypothetical protein